MERMRCKTQHCQYDTAKMLNLLSENPVSTSGRLKKIFLVQLRPKKIFFAPGAPLKIFLGPSGGFRRKPPRRACHVLRVF